MCVIATAISCNGGVYIIMHCLMLKMKIWKPSLKVGEGLLYRDFRKSNYLFNDIEKMFSKCASVLFPQLFGEKKSYLIFGCFSQHCISLGAPFQPNLLIERALVKLCFSTGRSDVKERVTCQSSVTLLTLILATLLISPSPEEGKDIAMILFVMYVRSKSYPSITYLKIYVKKYSMVIF